MLECIYLMASVVTFLRRLQGSWPFGRNHIEIQGPEAGFLRD